MASLLSDLLSDVRLAVRGLRHNPLFATVAILSLALGIGANAAIFRRVDQVLLRTLPVRAPHELVMLAQEGMTLEELKDRLVEMYAPEEIIRFEVIGRVSVSEKEVADYFVTHPRDWEVPASAMLREIVLLAEGAAREGRRVEAEKIRERAVAPGADFGALAQEVSEAGTKANGGLLGPVGKGDLAPPLDQAAFSVPSCGPGRMRIASPPSGHRSVPFRTLTAFPTGNLSPALSARPCQPPNAPGKKVARLPSTG